MEDIKQLDVEAKGLERGRRTAKAGPIGAAGIPSGKPGVPAVYHRVPEDQRDENPIGVPASSTRKSRVPGVYRDDETNSKRELEFKKAEFGLLPSPPVAPRRKVVIILILTIVIRHLAKARRRLHAPSTMGVSRGHSTAGTLKDGPNWPVTVMLDSRETYEK